MLPNYPVYIVSKGRAENGLTTRALHEMNVPHYIVVEEQEYEFYKDGRNFGELLVLPKKYKTDYELCDEHGFTKSTGPGPARNFCIDHSEQNKFKRHWVMDDNIDAFHYLNRNEKFEVRTGATLRAAEDFVDRYENVAQAGMQYDYFAARKAKMAPFILNSRIYSCTLNLTELPHRYEMVYNDDTDLSIRVLRDGWCTILFNAFLCGKGRTLTMQGGNADIYHQKINGRLKMATALAERYPDLCKVVTKFNRPHHHVDYSSFKNNKLIFKKGFKMPTTVIDEYGMEVIYYKEEVQSLKR